MYYMKQLAGAGNQQQHQSSSVYCYDAEIFSLELCSTAHWVEWLCKLPITIKVQMTSFG